jgi:hypothetical protein
MYKKRKLIFFKIAQKLFVLVLTFSLFISQPSKKLELVSDQDHIHATSDVERDFNSHDEEDVTLFHSHEHAHGPGKPLHSHEHHHDSQNSLTIEFKIFTHPSLPILAPISLQDFFSFAKQQQSFQGHITSIFRPPISHFA